MTWNFDMDAAPRGAEVVNTQRVGKNDVQVSRWVAPMILAAGPSGNFVGATKWDNKRKAWVFFSEDAPPIAWMPFPSHPHEVAK